MIPAVSDFSVIHILKELVILLAGLLVNYSKGTVVMNRQLKKFILCCPFAA
ncbi:hypothetical protein D3C85_1716320 [compost metagenome]